MANAKQDKRIRVRLPDYLSERLFEMAKEKKVSMSTLIERILTEYLLEKK